MKTIFFSNSGTSRDEKKINPPTATTSEKLSKIPRNIQKSYFPIVMLTATGW